MTQIQIDINTRLIALIGKPLGQSFSARMENAGYASANYNMLYVYNETEDPGACLQALLARGRRRSSA